MDIREVKENKKRYISLLLLADEQENMIDRYLDIGSMYVLMTVMLRLNALLPTKVTE